MRVGFLDNIIGKWARAWIMLWSSCGVVALSVGFWLTTEHSLLDWFYLLVSWIGLLCVVSLSFRRNLEGNGLGLVATAGEVVVQGTSGAVGLMLAPTFNFFTHIYGIFYWAKNTDGDGNMIPKSATVLVWLITFVFIVVGLFFFPFINNKLEQLGFLPSTDSNFYWFNVMAFVVAITAQVMMILRYSLSWWLWIMSNMIWLVVNLMSANYIFAIQTVIYQINAIIGLYAWYRSEQI